MSPLLAHGTVGRILRRPRSIPGAVRASFALAPIGWWRRPPFLPLPDKRYWQFRLETSSGGEGTTPPSPDEVVEVVEWSQRMRQQRR